MSTTQTQQPDFIQRHLATIDLFTINFVAVFLDYHMDYINVFQQLALFVGINISWFLTAYFHKAYRIRNVMGFRNIARSVFNLMLSHITTVTFIYCYSIGSPFPKRIFTLYIFVSFFSLILARKFYQKYLENKERRGYQYRNVMVLGDDRASAKRLIKFFSSSSTFGVNLFKNDKINIYRKEDIELLKKKITHLKINDFYWSQAVPDKKLMRDLITWCENQMVRFHYVPEFSHFKLRNISVDLYEGLPVLHYRKEPLERFSNRVFKRCFDIFFSSLVIIFILSWLIPLVWIAMRFSMPGPLFFIQERSGKNDETFRMIKFRSMKVNKDSDKQQATKDDNRITKLGSILRKSSLDEMPQFINVFLGTMTVVGPRPHMLKHTEEYSALINTYMVRHLVKPGITGWAQVTGYRGGTETLDLMEGRVKRDIWYLENWSLLLDIKVVYLTVKNALMGEENAY
ncbi:glycosyltransferase [Lentisphaera araneosa HTCC2155]|jgi:putative colanic acid biosysnthesis UDP-glucose lipid carrier transferase|uniref:Glycosyltransferase n=1 Tax=Lentisphaera araneosa HTCC2155 TaxID=313628 RepID=A6DQH9_9BACT|nr:exopolysaccharide biosynthesis polyprenyl glycosylphosphotransferase [Lentisphaera araneosa]EDM26060.1 glycosyltransferase [Lentisphaera araneosa HTCC2155]